MDQREALGRLLTKAFWGRNLLGAWRAFNKRMQELGEPTISFASFRSWVDGNAFPATRAKQEVLAEIVDREEISNEIRNLRPPAFRGFAHALMRGEPRMNGSGHGLKKARIFPTTLVKGEDGQTTRQAVIVCSACNERATHLRRNSAESDQHFERLGWQVGRDEAGDKCPGCRKVVQMRKPEDKPADVVPEERKQTGNDRLVIGMKIGDNFDEGGGRYKHGCSDAKLAEELAVPIAWVKGEREHLYPGSVGDDPAASELVAQLAAVKAGMADYNAKLAELTASVASTEELLKAVNEAQRNQRITLARARESRDAVEGPLAKLFDTIEGKPAPFPVEDKAAG